MKRVMLCVLSLAILSGCATYPAMDHGEVEAMRHDVAAGQDNGGPAQVPSQARTSTATEAPLERAELRIQRAGWIRVDSKNEMQASNKLRRMAAQFDATVMSFSDRAVSFKMPSTKIETLLEVLENTEGWEVDEFDFSAWDRTGEFYSVEARIESTGAVKARLLKLLESAATMDEVLKIHGKLEAIQKELDGYQGALRDIQLRAGRVDVTVMFD